MYLENLKRVVFGKEGLRLTFSSGDSEESLELGPLTLRVLGHQVVRTPEAFGLLLRTEELGGVVFSLPPAILQMLIADLMHLASSRPTSPAQDVMHARGKTGARNL